MGIPVPSTIPIGNSAMSILHTAGAISAGVLLAKVSNLKSRGVSTAASRPGPQSGFLVLILSPPSCGVWFACFFFILSFQVQTCGTLAWVTCIEDMRSPYKAQPKSVSGDIVYKAGTWWIRCSCQAGCSIVYRSHSVEGGIAVDCLYARRAAWVSGAKSLPRARSPSYLHRRIGMRLAA